MSCDWSAVSIVRIVSGPVFTWLWVASLISGERSGAMKPVAIVAVEVASSAFDSNASTATTDGRRAHALARKSARKTHGISSRCDRRRVLGIIQPAPPCADPTHFVSIAQPHLWASTDCSRNPDRISSGIMPDTSE